MELLGLTRTELSRYCEELGYPAFRGRQIADWLYKKGVRDLDAMTNLPAAMLERLKVEASIGRSDVLKQSRSADGTTKFLLRLVDGETIESVLLPYPDRTSVCVSSQVGCAVGCLFCATAECGLVRNLKAGEIVDQVLTLQERGGRRVTHVVFMGMGEPLANLSNVLKAIELLHDEVGISMRRLTISTVGITPAIKKLAEMNLQLTLAVSLHAPNDALRQTIIPMAARYPLSELLQACREYVDRTKRRITFEYLLLADINDSLEQARDVARLLKGMLCHVNLIPYNKVLGKKFERPSQQKLRMFKATLEQAGIEVTQRIERGHAISGACGQLRHLSRDIRTSAPILS